MNERIFKSRRSERQTTMPTHSRPDTIRMARKVVFAAALAVSAVSLTACGANQDRLSTGALPDDYRTRHPIMIAEAEHTIDIPVASGDIRLQQGTRDVISGFAADYANSSSGPINILLPSGSSNAHAAHAVRREIRGLFVSSGIPASRLFETSYQAGSHGDAAPIRLSYHAITAKTEPCGNWPSDLISNTSQNRNYENFGCASQSNLAAQIANPADLIAPRKMSPIDAARRGQVIKDYRNIDTE